MTLKLFPESRSEPWSSLLSGMFTTLRRTTSTENSPHILPTTIDAEAEKYIESPDGRDALDGRPGKRRRVAADKASTTRSRSSAQKTSPSNTIDRYFSAGPIPKPSSTHANPSTLQLSEQSVHLESPKPHSLYDTIQQRVHEAETKSEDKRTLRSHDESAKWKSDLASYLPQYEDIINDVPKAKEMLNTDTILIIKDHGKGPDERIHERPSQWGTSTKQQSYSVDRAKFPLLDLSVVEKHILHHPQDPLSEDHFFKAHRKAERREKQLRNIEKERAMHEKVHLERLLDGLKSHDWLRVMGVTGITDGESSKFESKRDLFIREIQALVDKFKEWREEEKRLKLEKAQNLKADDDSAAASVEAEDLDSITGSSAIDTLTSGTLPKEVKGSLKIKIRHRISAQVPPIVYREPTPEGPFLSFFSKPHLRAASLSSNRHGRTSLAFGHAVPEMDERDFSLPPDYITPDSLKESARRRRRMKRESLMNSTS